MTRLVLAAIALLFVLESSAAAQAMFTASVGNVFGGEPRPRVLRKYVKVR